MTNARNDDRSSRTEAAAVPIVRETDVLVVGGGPSGVCAALSAAREGADVTLLERSSFLGGTATAGLMAGFMGFYWRAEVPVTGGVPLEIVERLRAAGGGKDFITYTLGELTDNPADAAVFPFDPEVLKLVLDDFTGDAGVEVVHHTQAAEPLVVDGEVSGVVYQGLSDRRAIRARRVIDATGDGMIAEKAGAALTPDSTQRQPMTLLARVAGVDRDEVRAFPKPQRREIVHEGVRTGNLFYETLAMYPCPTNGDVFLLMTAVNGYDAQDEFELTGAVLEARRQIRLTMDYLRAHMPGFANAQVTQTAPSIGVRETRRVTGQYVLTGDDVRYGREFDDAIAWGGGPMDTHVGHGVRLEQPKAPFATPYRCLVPDGIDHVLVVGRAASATQEAMSGLRHMGAVMPLGEAAGVAAAKSLDAGVGLSDVDIAAVQGVLRDRGAIVDRPDV